MALGVRLKDTATEGCDLSSPVSVRRAARCEPACLRAAVVPPAPAAGAGQAAITMAAALADSSGEMVTFRGRGELGPLDVAWLGGRGVSLRMLRSRRQTPDRDRDGGGGGSPAERCATGSECWRC